MKIWFYQMSEGLTLETSAFQIFHSHCGYSPKPNVQFSHVNYTTSVTKLAKEVHSSKCTQ